MSDAEFEIEPSDSRFSAPCKCCGKARRTAWGYVYRDGGPRAAYFVEWTVGRGDHGARVDVVVGDWIGGATEADREAVSLQYSRRDGAPTFDLVDAAGRPAAEIGRATARADVIGTPLAAEVLTIAGAILANDERVAELRP